MDNPIETLRGLHGQERLRVTMDGGETYYMHAYATEYEAPDNYGAGYVGADVEFDTDRHDCGEGETLPSEVGDLSASSDYLTTEFGDVRLAVVKPTYGEPYEYDGQMHREIVDHEIISLGMVTTIEVLDDE